MSQVKQKYFIEISEKLYSKIKKNISASFFSRKKRFWKHIKKHVHI